MTLHQSHLVAFAAGSVIHAVQAVLVWKLWRHTSGSHQSEAKEGFAICLLAFFWQAGNFWREMAITFGLDGGAPLFDIGYATQSLALLAFPVLFSYMVPQVRTDSRTVQGLAHLARALRYPLWAFAITFSAILILGYAGVRLPISSDIGPEFTLNVMLFYFAVFFICGVDRMRTAGYSAAPAMQRAGRALIAASLLAGLTFLVMLWSPAGIGSDWAQLAAQMTSVPFTIAMAYRLYQFPFMDAFLREVLSGVLLLLGFAVATHLSPDKPALNPLYLAAVVLGLAYAKGPLSRWVDRKLLGYRESAEDQEERVGMAIRALPLLAEFGSRAGEVLRAEFEADWVDITPQSRNDAVVEFVIPGSTPMLLSLGPRKGARSYMSRQLRVVRRAVLELAGQHERLQREEADRRQLVQHHELREITARAQMRALQAQINPHFLFNTLNVLANLIHTNPERAENLTEGLAGIFRYALESTRKEHVPLDDELRFLESYLAIEKARFDERLNCVFDVDPGIRPRQIPPMILQPLVENAIQHGIGPKIEGGEVRIIGRAAEDRIMICIEDTGVGLKHKGRPGSGVGLANVRERLAHLYGELAVLRLEDIPDGGTRVVLVMPPYREVKL